MLYASLLLRQEQRHLSDSFDVIQGTLDLLILKALALEPVHAWGIAARIDKLSAGAFRLGQGSLYPAVHRFENRGWVASYWRATEKNRIARYYELTTTGRHALAAETEKWQRYTAAMDRVIEAR
jgi:PadR family transcriptional regulator, regulatory protein PadR